jgi:hypothetical protein
MLYGFLPGHKLISYQTEYVHFGVNNSILKNLKTYIYITKKFI